MNVFHTKDVELQSPSGAPLGLGLALVLSLAALFLGGIINGAAALVLY